MINKVLAIQNCGPSGTLLLQSLLDNHPQILTLPALHGQQLLIQWESLQGKSQQELISEFVQINEYWFEAEKQPGEDLGLTSMGKDYNEKLGIPRDAFTKHFAELIAQHPNLTRKDFICSVFTAYNQSLGKDISKAEYILYPIHCLPKKYAQQLVNDFSTARFLHTIRNSIQSMGSMAKHIRHNDGWQHLYLLNCVTSQMLNDFTIHAGPHRAYGMHAYFADTADRRIESRAIKLEDLHKQLKQSMTAVCQWLGLNWDDCLLTSTFDGKLWNNRPASIRQTGAGSKIISQQHQDVLSRFDKFRLELLSSSYLIHYKYKNRLATLEKFALFTMPLLIFLPFKMENIKTEILNHFKRLDIQPKDKPNIRHQYGILGRLFAHKLTKSRFIDFCITTSWYLNQYLTCRIKQLLPITLKVDGKLEYIELLPID